MINLIIEKGMEIERQYPEDSQKGAKWCVVSQILSPRIAAKKLDDEDEFST